MLDSFLKYAKEYCLLESEQRVLITVSGGIDSMVMADLFMKSGISAGIAHCNFRLRGSESDADEKFVREFAAKYNYPVYIKTFDTSGYAASKGISIQMAARDLRYKWFEELIQSQGYRYYSTAHHFDDQVETFFINLLRGTGVAGLTGIAPRVGHCIRPLLFADKKMILKYAKENEISFREDSSNLKDDYLRNRIRHLILPALEKTDFHYKSGMEKTFTALEHTSDFIASEIIEKTRSVIKQQQEYLTVDIQKLKQEKHPEFVLFHLLLPYGFNYSGVSGIIKSIDKEPGKRFLSKTHELVIDRKLLILSELNDDTEETCTISASTKEITYPVRMNIKTIEYLKQDFPDNPDIAWLDYDKLHFPLEIRNYRKGDSFVPLGMSGRKKLSDFMIDQKIPLPEKRKIKLLTSGGKIAWVIGYRIDNRVKVTKNTTRILALELFY